MRNRMGDGLGRGLWCGLSRWLVALCLSAGCLGAAAATVTSTYTQRAGADWSVQFDIRNDSLPSIAHFTIYFDQGSYTNLVLTGTAPDWDSLLVPPDAGVPADGFLDALALDAADALAPGAAVGGFSVQFSYLGAGAPGALAFDIVDADFNVVESGRTQPVYINQVSEPGALALLGLAASVALMITAWARRRPRLPTAWRTGAAGLLCAGLAACGGSDNPDTTANTTANTAADHTAERQRAQAVGSVSPGPASAVRVDAITLVAQRRISRTVFEYDYQLTLHNGGGRMAGVALQLQTVGAGTSIVDGAVAAGLLAAGGTSTPADRITLRHDRLLPFNTGAFAWLVSAAGGVTGTAAVGAALAQANVQVTDINGANVCAEARVVTSSTGTFDCTVLPGRNAPFLVVVTEPFQAYPPMVSVVATTPAAGSMLVANATPLTTAIVGQLAPSGNALDVVANPALINLAALAATTANVLTQIAPALAAVGAPQGYDPFSTSLVAATPTQAGNTADMVIELLRFSIVNGIRTISTVDNPGGAVPLAGPATVNPPVIGSPSAAVFALTQTMPAFTEALRQCLALTVAGRVLAVNNTLPANAGGAMVTQMAPACMRSVRADYRHAGYVWGQRSYGLLTDARMVGAQIALPELMLFVDDTTAADRDVAVLNFRYTDNAGNSGNFIEVARKLPGSATATWPSDWWLQGNLDPVDAGIRAATRQREQLAPGAGLAGPFANAASSRYEAGVEVFVNRLGPGSAGLRAARVRGPGLPPAGLVLTLTHPSIISPDQTWMAIQNKAGRTDPADAAPVLSNNNIFILHRTVGLTGANATTTRPNPNAGNAANTFVGWAHPLDYGAAVGTPTEAYIDFASLRAHNVYTFELFYNGESAPRHVFNKTMLSAITPATFAHNLQWLSPDAATRQYLDPSHALALAQTTMSLSWAANPFAETVISGGVYAGGGGQQVNDSIVPVLRGATRATAEAPPGFAFPALTSDASSARTIQLRYRMLDGSYKDSLLQYN